MPALIPADNIVGALFIGTVLSSIVYGITWLQVYSYYSDHCSRDQWPLKSFIMSPRPARKILPTAKLTAENAANLELTSHRRAVAVASGCLAASPQPSSPVSASVSEPFTSTTPADVDVESSSPGPAPTRTSTKRPGQLSSHGTLDTDDDAAAAEDVPKAKKLKRTPGQGLQTDVSIIEIDDVDDLQNERLNKTDPTADIKAFFTAVPRIPGQNKVRMQCGPCA
ncbi:hypothetical protein EDB85DRAFT_1976911 [Lactarius pseudohatsudake]|nr:hypothetical protein EDB85DRAFT_1976911 [Lactarius pseudohatsudake]